MRFEKFAPSVSLRPYVRYFAVSENADSDIYKVFPNTGLVIGFQYKGRLFNLVDAQENTLATAGITGISNEVKFFKNSPQVGTILVHFTDLGFARFSTMPVHELFNQSISLEYLFDKNKIQQLEEELSLAVSDGARIALIERFLWSQWNGTEEDTLIAAAVKSIYESNGSIKIKELHEKLWISQSPFEKRFRKVVGTTAKKFASIVRFNTILRELDTQKSISDICYENNFFDQAHFIKDFKQYTGDTPENFRRRV